MSKQIDRSKNPYPIHLSKVQWVAIEELQSALMGLPKYSEVIRASITLGLNQLMVMEKEELAKTIRNS